MIQSVPVWHEMLAASRDVYGLHPYELTPERRRLLRDYIALERIRREAEAAEE